MANNAFSFTAYGEATTYDAKNGGWQVGTQYQGASYLNFPVVGIKVTAISPAMTLKIGGSSVTINSIVEVFPTGLVTPGFTRKYLSDATIATLATART